ncbi:rhodanese-like domain-containing protein [Halalkalicoccus subterraneus]|uniref:rhodanese-like domain-containing protein n=1 Tax=Halalkalicoccus subterraneus TaxID=2675002 RepID=UPI000EFDB12C|nr:rhodanese-like domain-containing protein [Halalkalicoccus subterraneus]
MSDGDTGGKGVVDHGPESFRDVVARPAVYTLDVHTPEQRHIEGTDAFVPYDAIHEHRNLLPEEDTPIAVYCRSDGMSREVTEVLLGLGYEEIHHLAGGIRAWKEEGLSLSEHRFGEPGVRADV